MYKAFFNLKSKPFEISTDSKFLWLGEKHKEALAALRYGILENKGFLLMTSDAGTGKTALVHALVESLDDTVLWTVINDPTRERLDFYNAIARGFGINKEFTSKVQFLIQFSHFLHQAEDEKKNVLLLIDDCHRLSQEMLEELRLLSNIEKDDAKLINIFFVGQREFNDMLILPNNRAVRQRLTIKVDLAPLTAEETDEYIRHRLKIAGTEEKLFSVKAIQTIHRYSMGIPKRINIICDHALVAGCVQGKGDIDHKLVEDCIQKLNLPQKPTQEDFEGLDEEKSHLEHFKGRFTPGTAEMPAVTSGINLESDGRWGWVKYGLVAVILVVAAGYYWYPQGKTPEIGVVDIQKVEQQPVAKEMPQVRASPAVTVLEQNPEEINEKKAAELKHAILEKAYSNGENSRPGSAGQTVADKVALNAGRTAELSSTIAQSTNKAVVQQVKPTPAAAGESVVDGKMDKPAVHASIPVPAVVVSKAEEQVPALPAKIVLPLRSNSLRLTSEANKEYKEFIDKLKFYPKAKLLVKGFVSSTVDSSENVKLSEDRAMAVHKMLVASGVDAARLEMKGMGILEPIASNKTSDGRDKNRRVEIVVLEKK